MKRVDYRNVRGFEERIQLRYKIAEVCRWVPAHAPRTYWEAIQMYWFVHLGTITELNGWDYIGYLSIPSIGLELPVMSQWSYAGLKIAPGRYSGSTYADNMVVCAHNYAKHFSPIKWLTEGAQVYFTDMDGMRWTYEVSYVENLQPTQIEEMTEKTEESDEWDLTLFTCTTGGSARCAVRCVRTSYPALTTETAE